MPVPPSVRLDNGFITVTAEPLTYRRCHERSAGGGHACRHSSVQRLDGLLVEASRDGNAHPIRLPSSVYGLCTGLYRLSPALEPSTTSDRLPFWADFPLGDEEATGIIDLH